MDAIAQPVNPELQELAQDAQAPEGETPVVQDYGPNNRDLPENLKKALKALVKKFAGQDKYARRNEVIEARRQRFYWRGDQYIYWNSQLAMFMPVSAGVSVTFGSDAVDMPRYTDVYNIYTPYGRSIVAVLTQNPPGVSFEPDDPSNPADITAASAAEKYRHQIDRVNQRKALQQEIARLFFTDGRVVLYTRHVKDAQKFGTNPQTGEPNGGEIISAFGVLESKVPIIAKQQARFPYLILCDELEICDAKDEYRDFKDQIKRGTSTTGEDAYERMARLGVLQGTRLLLQAGDAYAHLVSRQRAWLRPSAFEEAAKDDQDQLRELFPDGAHVDFCGDAYCGSWNESMDDCLKVGHALPGDGQNRASWGKAMVPIQDAFNDYKNMRKEYHDYGIPVTWCDSEIGDINALREQVSEPGNHISAKRPPNTMAMGDAFFTEAAASPPADLLQAEQDLRGQLAQFVTGALPALFGGDMPDQKTASGYAMARDQAMGVMGVPWGVMQEILAGAYRDGVIAAAKHRAEEEQVAIKIPGKNGAISIETVAIADLRKGDFHCYPETDSSFPETQGAKKNVLMAMWQGAAQSPAVLEILLEGDNLELFREVNGLDELDIPGADARNRQLREIAELLKEVPIPDPAMVQAAHMADQAAQAGAMPPPNPKPEELLKPSIEVDQQFDLHKYHWEAGLRWWTSPEREAEEKENPDGVMNVRLHLLQHFQFLQQQAAPPVPARPAPLPTPQPTAAPTPGGLA